MLRINGRIAQAAPAKPKRTSERQRVELRHKGGGWYELPDGRRVKGRRAAERAMLEEG